MKFMKKWSTTKQNQISIKDKRLKRRSSADRLFTSSSVSAVTSLILVATLSLLASALSILSIPALSNNASAYEISMTSSGAQSIDVLPSSDSSGVGTTISSDSVSVTTTCPSGYNLTTTTSVSDNNLYLNGSSSNNQSGKYFTPSDGTTALSSAANTWGFYQNGTTTPTTATAFKAVPTSSSAATTIRTGSTSGTDSFNIYYGVAVGSNLASGSYKMIPDTNNSNTNGSVIYYLTMSTSCLPYTVVFNPTSTAGGTTISGTGTMASQTIPTGVSTALNANTFTAPSGYEFDSWNTKQDGTGTSYTDGQSVTNLTTGGQTITLYAQWKKSDPCLGKTALYDLVACRTKGPQTLDQLRTAITADNSGVYEYDADTFGTSSDASNDKKIYYYRGILDNTTGSHGSDGDNAKYPNTVVLSSASDKSGLTTSDTCWRIIRTTGSGGVKMIYQGKWTGSTCANATTAAQVTTSAFSGITSTYRQIVRVGYTYNSTYATNSSQSGTIAQIFGSNSNSGANDTRSDIKTYIEDTWYPSAIGASSGHDFTSKLEASAGYCNDRTMNTSTSWTTPLAESTTIASTYGTSGQQAYYFGARPRNTNTAQSPSLTCGNKYSQIDRSTVDLYRYVSGSTGVSNQLKYPAALITADEAAFAGSGYSSSITPYHANSYLRSGSNFWLLSPYYRDSNGSAFGFSLTSSGNLNIDFVSNADGVRPAISLTSGTSAVNGTGTATDPWIVNP